MESSVEPGVIFADWAAGLLHTTPDPGTTERHVSSMVEVLTYIPYNHVIFILQSSMVVALIGMLACYIVKCSSNINTSIAMCLCNDMTLA